MPDTSRPIESKIAAAVERMRKVQDAAKGLRETSTSEGTPRVEIPTPQPRR
jgi:hypothetical protein